MVGYTKFYFRWISRDRDDYLAVLEGRFSRGARRSDGADRSPRPPGVRRSPCGRPSRCGSKGASPNPRRAGRPDVISSRRPVHRSPPSTASARRPDPRRARVRRSRTVSFPVLLTRYHSDEPPSRPPSTQAVRRAGAPPVRDHRERREKNLTSKPPPSFLILVSTLLSSSRVRVRPRLARPSPSSRRRVPRASRGGLPLARFPHLT